MSKRAAQRVSWTKVERALRHMGIAPQTFLDAYESKTRLRRAEVPLSAGEISAVEGYQKNGDLEALMRELGTRDRRVAERLIQQVVELETNPHVAGGSPELLPDREERPS